AGVDGLTGRPRIVCPAWATPLALGKHQETGWREKRRGTQRVRGRSLARQCLLGGETRGTPRVQRSKRRFICFSPTDRKFFPAKGREGSAKGKLRPCHPRWGLR